MNNGVQPAFLMLKSDAVRKFLILYVTVGNLHWNVYAKKKKKRGALKFAQGVFGQKKDVC